VSPARAVRAILYAALTLFIVSTASAQQVTLVSVTSSGAPARGRMPAISASGRYVVFLSASDNPMNNVPEAFSEPLR
jgi:hypothetical protein